MAEIKWPGERASAVEHLQYFIDAANRVAGSKPPSGYHYAQMPHGEGSVIGDPHKPAMLNASYKYFNRSLVSFSIPDFVRLEEGFSFQAGRDGQVKDIRRNMGLTAFNLEESLSALMKAHGIKTEETKIGHDRVSRTLYVEMDVDAKDYERAKNIMETIVRGREKTPHQILAQIKAGDFPRMPQTPPVKPEVPPIEVIPTNKGRYVAIDGMNSNQVSALKESFRKNGIDFTEKTTSLNGGMKVLSVPEQHATKLENFRATQHSHVSAPIQEHSGHAGRMRAGGGLVAGAALTAASGIAAAAEPGATVRSVGDTLADGFIPGWMEARKGNACAAFGQASGALASGAVVVAGAPIVAGTAVASGPAAPVVGVAGTAGLLAAGAATHEGVSQGAESLCRLGTQAYDFLKKQF